MQASACVQGTAGLKLGSCLAWRRQWERSLLPASLQLWYNLCCEMVSVQTSKQAPLQSNTTCATLPCAPLLCSATRVIRLLWLLLLRMSLPKLLVLGYSTGWGEVLLLEVQGGDVICCEAVHNLFEKRNKYFAGNWGQAAHFPYVEKILLLWYSSYVNNHAWSSWTNEPWERWQLQTKHLCIT